MTGKAGRPLTANSAHSSGTCKMVAAPLTRIVCLNPRTTKIIPTTGFDRMFLMVSILLLPGRPGMSSV
jgi:hypothetical protein